MGVVENTNDFILLNNEARILYTKHNPQNVKSIKENDHTGSVDGREAYWFEVQVLE